MTNDSADNTPPPVYTNPWGLESLTTRLYDYVDGLDKNNRIKVASLWGVVGIVLIVAASFPLPAALSWATPIVGLPAGVILFSFLLILVRTTKLGDLPLFNLKETTTQKRRLPTIILIVVVVMVVVIFVGSQIPGGLPTGIGGVIMVAAALSAYNGIRRTPYELELSRRGLPDPREYADEAEFYNEEPYDGEDFDGNFDERNNR